MRTLIVSEFTTLDGVMEAPGGEPSHPHTNWVMDFQGEEQIELKYQEVLDAGALLVGRVTYESFAGAWPDYEGDFADRMNAMPKYVVSQTMTEAEWNNTTVLAGDPVHTVAELKQGDGGPILVQGSCRLVHTLLDAGLVDEVRLGVFPVTIGGGLRVFPDTLRKATWRQVDSRTLDSGVRFDTYRQG